MKKSRIRILMAKGWYYVIYSVSFIVLSLLSITSGAKNSSKVIEVNTDIREISDSIGVGIKDTTVLSNRSDIKLPEDVRTIKMREFEGLMYGPPPVKDDYMGYEFDVIVK